LLSYAGTCCGALAFVLHGGRSRYFKSTNVEFLWKAPGKQRLIRIAKLKEIRFHQRFVLQSRLEAQAALLLAEDCCSRVL
jgi:hypothetical protein